jgi:hypothetical protein
VKMRLHRFHKVCNFEKSLTIKHTKMSPITSNLYLHVNLQLILNIAEMCVLDD